MKLSQYLNENDLMAAINDIQTYPFIDEKLNGILSFYYGEQTVFDAIPNTSINLVAMLIVNKYADKWEALINMDVLNITTGGVTKRVEGTTSSKTNNDSSSNINKVSGFNSDVLIVDTQTDNEVLNSEEGTGTKQINDYVSSHKELFNNLSYQDKTNIITVVLKDITNILTLDLY